MDRIGSDLRLGGGPVEIGSGMGGLAYAWVLGQRQKQELLNFRPHNVSLVGLGSEPSELVVCDTYPIADSLPVMVWMDRFQRRECLRRQPTCNFCSLEFNDSCRVRWDRLVFVGLPCRTTLEYGGSLLGNHCWSGGSDSILGFHPTLGIRLCRDHIWSLVQFCNEM